MEKVYAPQAIERRIYERWESHAWFAPSGRGAPYCIMIPPPNVTGTLHMGHAFQHTLMDALTRYERMRGRDALWQPGTDHAGIATQMVVERQLNAQGVKRTDLTREAFLERVWQWKAQSGGAISAQMRRLGDSVDWSRERFTMDPGLSRAVTEVFVRLHAEGLIYRGKRLVNWDPVLLTALSDLEVQAQEEDGQLWHVRYPLEGGAGELVVATTRPETILGDAAVAVHPQDPRYQEFIGKRVLVPLVERSVPVIADAYVDPAFGTGCLKVTPAHDFNDYDIGQRHHLALINIFTPRATLADTVPQRFRGLERFEARKRVLAELEAGGLIERVDKHRLVVPRGDRSGAVLEPYLTDQWYVRIAALAAPAIAAVEAGRTRFVPESWARTYFEWMRNIRDWCVSRQLWWGHRIPAWYDADGNIYVGRDEAEVRARHRLEPGLPLRQDEDVLDIWFSSALWPFSTLGWPEATPELERFYPGSVLVTGFDIIFFWVARMMMMGLKFMGEVPFSDVYITGLIRDEHGDKMSKSRGNVIDPLDIVDGITLHELIAKRTTALMQPQLAPAIERATRRQYPDGIAPHGTDALRFTFAALASPNRDIRFDLARVGGYRNFCNKLWNAARFVTLTLGEAAPPAGESVELSVADRWIGARFGRMLAAVESAFRLSLRLRRQRALRVHLVRLLRLVPRADQAAAAGRDGLRGRQARHSTHARAGAGSAAAGAPPADALHHRGNLAARGAPCGGERRDRHAAALSGRGGFPPGRGGRARDRLDPGGHTRRAPDSRRDEHQPRPANQGTPQGRERRGRGIEHAPSRLARAPGGAREHHAPRRRRARAALRPGARRRPHGPRASRRAHRCGRRSRADRQTPCARAARAGEDPRAARQGGFRAQCPGSGGDRRARARHGARAHHRRARCATRAGATAPWA